MSLRLAGHQQRMQRDFYINEALENDAFLRENYEAATAAILALRAEDVGWAPITKLEEDQGFTLENLQDIAELAELETTKNPLLKRGLTLRQENVFSKGINFDGIDAIQPRFKEILNKPVNQNALFTAESFTLNEKEAFVKGNLFMAYRFSTKTFYPIPFEKISNHASNPDVVSDVWYYQHTYTKIDPNTLKPEDNPTVEWYPVLERHEDKSKRPLLTSIAGKPVIEDVVIIDFKVNTTIGKVWGIPDVLPVMPYAWAHDQYIRDASKLLKALSTIAWKVVSKSKANANTAAGKLAAQKRAGSAAVMTSDTDITSMPKSGQVNMRDGQALAGYVASGLGVSLIALLSDPGTASGSYGAAATLDGPSANSARSRQALWVAFYNRIFRLLKIDKVTVTFPKLSEDPVFRQVQTITQLRVAGALWADEYRKAGLDMADITPLHETAPPADEYAQAQNAVQFLAQAQAAEVSQQQAADVASGQGKSGAVGKTTNGDNSARDASATPGTGT